MTKKTFTLLFVMMPFFGVLGQIPTPSLVAGNSDVINLSSSPYPSMLVQSGSEDFYWIGGAFQGTTVNHPMLSEVYSDYSNIYFIKYDKDENPLGSAYIRGSNTARNAFSFGGGLTVVGSASNDIEANGNTLPINSADNLEFIAKYNDLCQFERMVSIWDLEPSLYPYSTSMMDPRTGTLFLAGTSYQPYNLRTHGIIGKDMEDYFYLLSYDRNLVLTGVFTAGMEQGGEYGYYENLEIIPDGRGSVIITGSWQGDRSPVIDGDTLSSTMESHSVFAVKLDKNMKKEWVLQGTLNGFDYDGGSAITEGMALKNGDLVMVGVTSTGHFSLDDVKLDFENGAGYSNIFAFRLSQDGSVQWVRPIQNMMEVYLGQKGAKSEEFTPTFDRDAVQWNENLLYLAGKFMGDQFSVAGRSLENKLGTGAFVAALDMETGVEQWGYSLSSTFMELNGFDVDGSGNATLMGKTGSEQQYEGFGTVSGEAEMVFHLGLDFNGKPLWYNNAYLDPPAYNVYGSDLEVLKNGEVFSSLYKNIIDNPLVIGGATIISKDPNSSILVKLSAATEVGGLVYDKSGTPVYHGIVKAYKVTAKGAYPVVDSVYIDDSGRYTFQGIYPGSYKLRAIPELKYYPDGMPTYEGGAIIWNEAHLLDIPVNERTSTKDITLSELAKLTPEGGSGKMSGNVSNTDDVVAKGTLAYPANKTAVILKRKAASKGTLEEGIVAYLDTDEDGNFVFENVPNGEYNMIVDVPGLPMNGNYDVLIEGNTVRSGLNFIIDVDGIYIPGGVGIEPVEMEHPGIFPNPGNGVLNLEFKSTGDYHVQVYSTEGKMVAQRNCFSVSGLVTLDLSDLDRGMYLIRIKGEELSRTVKYVKR